MRARFRTHYAPFLEGLFSDIPTPNDIHAQSALLFWTIVYVGSRRYKTDLAIHHRLGPLVMESAFTSLISPARPLPVILAAIILCSWPPPVDLVYKDCCPALAGAALNLAVQNGLHTFRREHEFVNRSRKQSSLFGPSPSAELVPLETSLQDPAIIYRTRLWAYCVITFQRYDTFNRFVTFSKG